MERPSRTAVGESESALRKVTTRLITRAMIVAAAVIGGQLACASPGIPPGGPVDTEGPKLIGVVPDSGKTGIMPSEVVFHFDEVVSERPQGAPSLDGLFLISPRDGTPNVSWHRKDISVRPHRGWKPNTTYTVTMLGGITDLRGNVRNTGATLVFSTGPAIATSRIAGTVFNWIAGTAAPRALIEARPTVDTTTMYVAVADSTGTFLMRNVTSGTYRVRGIIDENSSRGLDPREAWDTSTVTLTDSAHVELYAFPHDSVGARLSNIGVRDSVTLELIFDHAINVNQQLTPQSILIRTPDSATVPVLSIVRPVVAADTTAPARARPSRGIPSTSLLVRLGIQIKKPTTLHVRTIGIQGLDGVGFTSDRTVTVTPPTPPAPPPPPPPPPVKR